MAVLTWSRLDATIATNHKTLTLLSMRGGDHAILVYLFSHGYCIAQGTDGFIPAAAIGTFHGSQKDAAMLVEVGFWDVVPGGWEVHDWRDYQPSSEETEKRSARARAAAAARWEKAQGSASSSAGSNAREVRK